MPIIYILAYLAIGAILGGLFGSAVKHDSRYKQGEMVITVTLLWPFYALILVGTIIGKMLFKKEEEDEV